MGIFDMTFSLQYHCWIYSFENYNIWRDVPHLAWVQDIHLWSTIYLLETSQVFSLSHIGSFTNMLFFLHAFANFFIFLFGLLFVLCYQVSWLDFYDIPVDKFSKPYLSIINLRSHLNSRCPRFCVNSRRFPFWVTPYSEVRESFCRVPSAQLSQAP